MIQHAFSKPSLVNLISKDANLVLYFLVGRLFLPMPQGCLRFVIVVFPDHTHYFFIYQFTSWSTLQTSDYDLIRFSVNYDVIKKVQRHDDLIEAHAIR